MTSFHSEIVEAASDKASRIVVVRYFLDRPGYDIDNSSSRLWINPPASCTPKDIAKFLNEQGIREENDKNLLAELYLDKFRSYMLLEVCSESGIQFNFSGASAREPGVLNIRLTDVSGTKDTINSLGASSPQQPQAHQQANTSPVGLFAFSLTVALETAELFGRLVPGTVNSSFILTFAPYAFFVSGLLQLIVGILQVNRNNIYGATAFMAFGSFWLANGLKLILMFYFPDEINPDLFESDPTGVFIRNLWILGFVCVLFYQTLTMNKVTSILIAILVVELLATAVAGWSQTMEWIQMVMGWVLSVFAFYVFAAELTNDVYHREVFDLHSWSADSPEEIFGAPGRRNKLQIKAIELRTARQKDVHDVRAVRPFSVET